MIKVEKIEVSGIIPAIRGMRNPMNSWEKSDSDENHIGKNDLNLMRKLAKAGSEHRKYLRMITVTMDITAPLYWWKEFDTYKIGTVSNSCSTMHKIHAKEFTMDDFSHEHLILDSLVQLDSVIGYLNAWRELYNETKDKDYWWQMIQMLPSSYNQKRTVMINYEVAYSIYCQRKNHKLDEWRKLCDFILDLPYFKEIFDGNMEES